MKVKELVIAGWTGRDEAALKKHIKELEEIGVKPPKTTPIFYRVAASLFTHAEEIQVSGPDTSGEVEFVLIQDRELRVAVGSDHTDRKAETVGVSLSKQLCAKPVSRDSWRYEEVKPHWEKLILRSWADGELYQEGPVTAMRSPEDLMGRYPLKIGYAMFCGTLAARGRIRPAARFGARRPGAQTYAQARISRAGLAGGGLTDRPWPAKRGLSLVFAGFRVNSGPARGSVEWCFLPRVL